jgi:hypothetical protein
MPDLYNLDAARPADEAPTTDCVGNVGSAPATIAGVAETRP